MKKDAQTLHRMARAALEKAGAHSKMAEAAARHLVRAEEQGLPTLELDRLVTETMDLASHRLDAWLTALASRRLREMRHLGPVDVAIKRTTGIEHIVEACTDDIGDRLFGGNLHGEPP